MHNDGEFEKIEKMLKNMDLPDFEISQHRRILRRALLNSPYFDERKGIISVFASILAPVSAVGVIVLFIFLGYPYLHYFYRGAQAKDIVNKLDSAINNMEPNKSMYAVMSDETKTNPDIGKLQDISENQLGKIKESLSQQSPPLTTASSNQSSQQNIKKIDFKPAQIKEAKFLQYVGEEKVDDSVIRKIRFTNQKGDLVTQIEIESKTNLPVKIDSWKPMEIIKNPTMLTDPKAFFSEEPGDTARSTMIIKISNDDTKDNGSESHSEESRRENDSGKSESLPSASPLPAGN